MLTTKEVILAGIQSAHGTPATLTGTDAVLCENLAWSNEALRMVERKPIKNTFGPEQEVYGGTLKTFTFDVELKGSGTAGTAPEYGPLLRASRLSETIVASTSVTYAPTSGTQEYVTVEYYQDGTVHKITDAVCKVSGILEAGSTGKLSFTVTGHVTTTADAVLPTPTYDSTLPPAVLGASFAIGGYAAIIKSFNFDLGNAVIMPEDMNEADGFGVIEVADRDVTGSFDPEAVLVATNNFEADFAAGTTGALTTGTIGATAGNIYAISEPVVYYRDIAPGEREQKRTYEMGYRAVESSGDDQWSLALT